MADQNSPSPSPSPVLLLGLLLLTCTTLLLQITWTRVLSVSLYYHFAFLVVSTAMLGFGISGVLLTVSRRLAGLPLGRGLLLFSSGQALTTLAGFALANQIPFAPFSMLSDSRQLLYAPAYLLCIATPFVFSGLCAALLLTRCTAHAGKIYFYDLLGAGLGCFAVVLIMPVVGASGTVVVSAAMAVGATLCFALGTAGPRQHRAVVGCAAVMLILGLLVPSADELLPIRISPTKRIGKDPAGEVLRSEHNLLTAWNTSSRIDVLPSRWGRSILIDGGTAMTRMPRVTRPPAAMGPISDERRIVLHPGAKQSVLIIGSGGGWEVLAALRCDARRVVAVEINPLINHLVAEKMADFVGRMFADPAVELHDAEARSFIRRRDERYDLIMASHTISNAATASGAMSLSEEYILTREAFADYLAHLTERGRLWISRPAAQLPRLVTTARSALEAAGTKQPARHVLVFVGGPFYGGVVVSRRAFSPAEVKAARRWLAQAHLRPLHLPDGPGSPAPRGRSGPGQPLYRQLLEASPEKLERLYSDHPTQLRPADDDRPFFNQRTRWRDIDSATVKRVFTQQQRGRMALEDQPVAEVVLLVVLLQSTGLALVLVLAPLWWRKREGLRGTAPLLAYFLLLGLGFILIEIALIQRLTLFVGQPVHTFAVVVGSLLIASGLGSLSTRRIVPRDEDLPRRLRRLLLGISALVILFDLVTPSLLSAALGLPFVGRVAIAVALLAPLGFALGTAFPLGLRHAGVVAPTVVPWAWGLNAVASVVGSVGAIILATGIGFSRVLLTAAVLYGLAALVWLRR